MVDPGQNDGLVVGGEGCRGLLLARRDLLPQPGQALTQAQAGSTFGILNSTLNRTVGLGTNRQMQFALRVLF